MTTIEAQGKTIDEAISNALTQLHVSREQVSVEILDGGSRGFFGLMGTKPAVVKVTVTQEKPLSEPKSAPQPAPEIVVAPPRAPRSTEARKVAVSEPLQAPVEKEIQAPVTKEPAKPAAKAPRVPIAKEPETPIVYNEEEVQQIIARAKDALQSILKTLDVQYTVEVGRHDDQILMSVQSENENFLIGKRGTTLDAIQYLVNRIANKQAEQKIQVVLDTSSNYRVNRQQRLQKLATRLSRRVKTTGKPIIVAPMNPHDRRIIHLTLQDDPSIKTMSRGTGFMRRIVISTNKNPNRNRSKS